MLSGLQDVNTSGGNETIQVVNTHNGTMFITAVKAQWGGENYWKLHVQVHYKKI